MAKEFDYVVLGAGNAAGYVAREFVEKGLNGKTLALITEEKVAPYERPALSKGFLFGKAKLPGFHTTVGGGGSSQDPSWYATHNITLLTNTKVVEVVAAAKELLLEDNTRVVAKEALVVATGSDVIRLTRNPGHGLNGIHYLRNVEDGEQLLKAIATAKKAVIVGGGYIGMECGAALSSQGIDVTMVFPEDRLMERLFTPELGALYEKYYTDKGIKIVKGALCTEFIGANEKVMGCKLNNNTTLECDLVVVGVGARPRTELLDGQVDMADRPLGGIKVDGRLQSSVKGVYAIGDVATFPLKRYSRLQRVEHVTSARQTAKHVVNVILGSNDEYDYLPHFYSRVFTLSWKFWGDSVGDAVVVGDLNPKVLCVWVENGQVAGAFLDGGSDAEFDTIRDAAAKRVKIDLEALKNAQSVDDALHLLA